MEPRLHALTVDVEEYFQVEGLARHVDRDEWDRLESRVEGETSRLLDLFAREGTKATFFTLGWVARRHPALVRRIVREGHELGSHGDAHRMITQMSREEFREDIRAAKKTLEDTAGVAVEGYRAPTFSVVQETLWALDELREAGFTYDASVFPIRHDRYGIPDAPRWPYRIESGPGAGLVEFPSSTLRVAGKNIPLGGGGYLRLLPMAYTLQGLRRLDAEGSFMVYLHPWEIDAQQPRFPLGRLAAWRCYHNLDAVEDRLTTLLRAFRMAPARDVLRSLRLLPPSGPVANESQVRAA
jgi:polysaccharide deacetylase family protein (PEP-CTERM system associated)